MRLPTMCVSEPMTPVTSVFDLDIDLTHRSLALALLSKMADERIAERDCDENHHRAADRPREEDSPVVLVADHAGHERALGLRAENAAEHHRRDRKSVLLEEVPDDPEDVDHPQVGDVVARRERAN